MHALVLDIGTTKICVLIAQNTGTGFEILGIGKAPSHGLAKGVVVDINRTVESIKHAVQEAELMASCKVESATIGISGSHIKSMSSRGMVPIKRGEIKESDMTQALQAARAVAVPEGHQILHVLPQYYIIDNQDTVTDPLGMYGVRLEVQAHIITGSVASVHNLVKCCEMAGVKVNDIVLEQLASADAVLTPDEKKLGVMMIDIGGGTSDVALFYNNAIRHTMVLPVAGNHFTNDVALGLHTSLAEAERVKKECGIMEASSGVAPLIINAINGQDQKEVDAHQLSDILHARAYELLALIAQDLNKHALAPYIPAGVIITGGGSLLKGMDQLAADIFKVPVRIGKPQSSEDCALLLNNPMYATGYGLLLFACKKNENSLLTLNGPLFVRIVGRMKSWMADFF